MMYRLLIIITSCFMCLTAQAQMKLTQLKGNAPAYANRSIELYVAEDALGLAPKHVGTIELDDQGNFESDILLNKISSVYAEFDHWHAFSYFNPGETYELVFPPYKEVTEAERYTPYFKLEKIPFGLRNIPESDINQSIREFEIDFSKIEDKYFTAIFIRKSKSAAADLKAEVNAKYPSTDVPYFNKLIEYNIAEVEYSLIDGRQEEYILQYFNKDELPFNLPVFKELFSKLFTNYLYKELIQEGNKPLMAAIGSGKLSNIEHYFTQTKQWTSALYRMVLICGINDIYNQNIYPKKTLQTILSQAAKSNWTSKEKELASKLLSKLTYLEVGTEAPDMVLTDIEGKETKLSSYWDNDKLVYLHFANPSNPISRHHLNKLTQIYEQYAPQINFVIVMPASNLENLDKIKEQNWKGNICFASLDTIKKYLVRTFPYSYLIDADGKLILSPANNPLEGAEDQFNSELRKLKLEQMRNQSR